MLAPYIFFYCIAGITDMPTTTDIIWMKDIKSNNHSSILIFCNSSINLFFKKVICFFCCKFFFLWKCYSISYDLIPNFCCILGILCFIFSYENVHDNSSYIFLQYIFISFSNTFSSSFNFSEFLFLLIFKNY